VGKSSLINSLVGRKDLARTSKTPGRTRVINFFNVRDRWLFVDLPGYGFAKVSMKTRREWERTIEEFFSEKDDLKLTVMVVDCRHEPGELDRLMQAKLEDSGIPYQIVAMKADKLSRTRLQKAVDRIQLVFRCNVIPYSAATGLGKKELWQVVERI